MATHHAYVKRELPRLAVLAQKVVNRHGDTQAHLPAMQKSLAQLDEELIHHLGKEEHVLFPYIAKLEAALASGSAAPDACFGAVANPIAMMTSEHDAAGALLAEIRRLSDNFTTPVGACPTYHAYYDGLQRIRAGPAPAHSSGKQHPVSPRHRSRIVRQLAQQFSERTAAPQPRRPVGGSDQRIRAPMSLVSPWSCRTGDVKRFCGIAVSP